MLFNRGKMPLPRTHGKEQHPARGSSSLPVGAASCRDSLILADGIHEPALVVVVQVREVVGEVREVLANAEFQVIAKVALDAGQVALARAPGLVNVQGAVLQQAIPFSKEMITRPNGGKGRGAL